MPPFMVSQSKKPYYLTAFGLVCHALDLTLAIRFWEVILGG
jgi:hypothetical protein